MEQYEIAIKLGGLRSMMTAFNRVGYNWAGASYSLCTELLRNEWGFQGVLTTDAYGPYDHMVMVNGVLAGQDTYLTGNQRPDVFGGSTGPMGRSFDHMGSCMKYYFQDPVGMGNALRSTVRNVVNYKMNSLKFQPDYVYQPEHYTDVNWTSTLTISDAIVDRNNAPDSVTFTVSISGNEGVSAMMTEFTGIDFTGATVTLNNEAYPDAEIEYNNEKADGSLKLVYWDIDPKLTDGLMLTITVPYENIAELEPGVYPITVIVYDVLDRLENANTIAVSDGSLKIGPVPGDVNGDYELTNADLIMIARYLVELETFNEEQMKLADFNSDGKIDNVDLVLIAKAIASR